MSASNQHSDLHQHIRDAIGMDEGVSGAAQLFCHEARTALDGLFEQIESLKSEVDGMARAPYGEYQKMRERAERAEEQLEAARAASSGLETALEQSLDREQSLSEQLEAYRAALKLWHEAYRPYREDMVMHALEATDAALASNPATSPLVDVDDLRAAFQEVLGYLTAYRVHGAEAGPDLGWAIRNFNEILDGLREESSPATYSGEELGWPKSVQARGSALSPPVPDPASVPSSERDIAVQSARTGEDGEGMATGPVTPQPASRSETSFQDRDPALGRDDD